MDLPELSLVYFEPLEGQLRIWKALKKVISIFHQILRDFY
jgi:hypothetical protein